MKRLSWRIYKIRCKKRNKESGKCKIKVHYRYNDYCEKDDCPRRKEKT